MTGTTALGRASLTRVVELRVQMTTSLFGQTPAQAWPDNADLLEPLFWDRAAEQWKIAMQTWVLRVDGLIVLVDTGVGNDRHRPHFPPLHQLQTGYLDALADAGVTPEAVDVVINTHLHTDHVGWNTRLVRGAWVPTFPNARYLMPEHDYRHFSPDGDSTNEACASCSPTACHRWPSRPSCTPGSTNSASRCGCARRRATRRVPRWCGWTPVCPPCSSAT